MLIANQHIDFIVWLAILNIVLPFLSFVVCGFIPETSRKIASWSGTILLAITTGISVWVWSTLPEGGVSNTFTWFVVGSNNFDVSIQITTITTVMALVVSIVALLVHVFSIGYMADDSNVSQYFSLLGFFTAAMLGLVWCGNLLLIFCFWELVGYASYRLIGFWNYKPSALRAATKSFIMNRVADAGFLIAIMIWYQQTGSLEINTIASSTISEYWQTLAMICLFIGVMGKSAQFPFFTWLPDAMEGPTPVSALIHAATMVAAGIYLLVRMDFAITPDAATFITFIGLLSALIGAINALIQFDLKKILAYSTMSQLGLMIVAIGIGSIEGGYLHLLNHAFFKAGLFLGGGAILHAYHHHSQDIRNLSIQSPLLKITAWSFTICSAALAAIPFTSGFVSKDVILTAALDNSAGFYTALIAGGVILVSLLTILYTFRLWWYLVGNQTSSVNHLPHVLHIPILILSFLSLSVVVSFTNFHFVGWIDWIFTIPTIASGLATIISISIGLVGFGIGMYLYKSRDGKFEYSFHTLVDRVYEKSIVTPVMKLSTFVNIIDSRWIDGLLHQIAMIIAAIAHLVNWLDHWVIDMFLVTGTTKIAKAIGWLSRSIINGKVQYYLVWALALLLIFILTILYF